MSEEIPLDQRIKNEIAHMKEVRDQLKRLSREYNDLFQADKEGSSTNWSNNPKGDALFGLYCEYDDLQERIDALIRFELEPALKTAQSGSTS